MNLRNTPLDKLREAFDLMEYSGFFEYSIRHDGQTILSALVWLNAVDLNATTTADSVEPENWEKEYKSYLKNEYDFFHLYGSGGGNRYFIYRDGRIKFSSGHACYPSEKTIQDARDLGFEVH